MPKVEHDPNSLIVGSKLDTLPFVVLLGVWSRLFACGASSAELSLRKRDSLPSLDDLILFVSDDSSRKPRSRASVAVKPLIVAGSVRPSRLASTSLFENVCFRWGFESVYSFACIKSIKLHVLTFQMFPRDRGKVYIGSFVPPFSNYKSMIFPERLSLIFIIKSQCID